MSDYNYRPNGQLQGDTKPINESGASKEGDYGKSLGGASKSDLNNGFTGRTSITGDTKSDKGFA